MTFGPLVTPEWLREHLDDPDVRVVDFRCYLLGGKGREAYDRSHIPGAVFVDLEAVTGKGGGRHPLPPGAQFEAEMRKAGVTSDSRVVVYDDAGGSVASRLWFLLRWFGHESQAVVDGGMGAWGGPLTTEVPAARRVDFRSREPDRSRILNFDDVRKLTGVPLIDGGAAAR